MAVMSPREDSLSRPMMTRMLSSVSTSSCSSDTDFDLDTESKSAEPESRSSRPSFSLARDNAMSASSHTIGSDDLPSNLKKHNSYNPNSSNKSNNSNNSNNSRTKRSRPASAKTSGSTSFRNRAHAGGHKFVQLQRQSTISPSETIKSLGIVSNSNDYFLKSLLWIPFGLVMTFIVISGDKEHLTRYLAYALVYIGFCAVGMVTLPAFQAKKLRAFETQHCRFKDFADIAVPYGIKEYPHEPVRSVSQLLAVRGTLWHGKICEASLITFIFVTMALVEKRDSFINALDGNNGVYASICGFLGGFGAWTVTSWELDMKDEKSCALHYFGVILTFIGSFALVIEQNYGILSISWIVVAAIAFVYWTYISKFWVDGLRHLFPSIKLHRFEGLKSNDIHRISLQCLAAESVALFCALMSLVCFVYQLDKY